MKVRCIAPRVENGKAFLHLGMEYEVLGESTGFYLVSMDGPKKGWWKKERFEPIGDISYAQTERIRRGRRVSRLKRDAKDVINQVKSEAYGEIQAMQKALKWADERINELKRHRFYLSCTVVGLILGYTIAKGVIYYGF